MIHRHLEVPPGTPPTELPVAALCDLLDRGDLVDWLPLLAAIEQAPHGSLSRAVARIIDVYPLYGTSPLFRAWIARCRQIEDARREERGKSLTLRALRHLRGKTQAQVAERMGISQSDYSKLERRRDVRVSTLRSLAKALGGSLRLVFSFLDGTSSDDLSVADQQQRKVVLGGTVTVIARLGEQASGELAEGTPRPSG